MAYAFNEEGITAVSLSGKDDYNKRSKAFTELQSDDCELEMITCVDILNEGVDIPAVNMVLFLRPIFNYFLAAVRKRIKKIRW